VRRADLCLLPPASRGDVARLVAGHDGPPGTIILADGRFGDVLAVGHRELLAAIGGGWQVWGVASMGAIRAAELHPYGMRGAGAVFRYMRDTMAPDDEVAVLHGPGPRYRPMSEALVDLRGVLEVLTKQNALTESQAVTIAGRLADLWFGERTLPLLVDLCRQQAGDQAAVAVVALLPRLARLRAKGQDLTMFLKEEPWLSHPHP